MDQFSATDLQEVIDDNSTLTERLSSELVETQFELRSQRAAELEEIAKRLREIGGKL